jgi:O-antigen/teichoic acid export membrane protein
MHEHHEPSVTSNIRLRRFFHAAVSGYVQLAANTLYVLASVPLALHFLQKREFGLWALAMQLTGYLQLIDFGMSASVSRHLIDHKDDRTSGHYGSTIQTGALVLLTQGFLVLLGGAALVFFGTPFLHVDPDLERSFKIVMLVQCGIVAIDFPARLFGQLLVANQRNDVFNYTQTSVSLVAYAVLWFCLAHGFGVFSLVWANLAGWLVIIITNAGACYSLDFLPPRDSWGSATWSRFRDLFAYGKDVFWIALGTQMINASQAIVVTRALGLNSAGIWSVCTRTYTLASQLVWRPFDSSTPALSEMVARGEKGQLLHRFMGLVVFSTSLSVVAAALFALCNGPFVNLWTHGKIGWGLENDLLLSIWLIISTIVHCLCTLPLITKQIRFMRYIYFLEGSVFIVIGSLTAARFGFSGLLATSIVASLAFSCAYGVWRTMREFGLIPKEIFFRWLGPSTRLFGWLGLFSLGLYWPTRSLPANVRLPLYLVLAGTAGILLFLWRGLSPDLRQELFNRTPISRSRALRKLFQVQ